MWSVRYTADALRTLSRMDPAVARRIRSKLLALAHNPRAPNNNVKKLTGVEGYRLRVGDWRVIYTLKQQALSVIVIKIGHRSEVLRMTRQIINQGGKPAFVVIPIDEWRRIEATLEDRIDARAVRAFLKTPAETFPDSVAAALLEGVHPVKALREHRHLTQAQLAKAAGTSAVYISQIERGGRRAGRKLLAKLAKALGVDRDLLEQDGG